MIQGPLSSNSHFLKTVLTFLFIDLQLSTYSNEPGVGFLIGPSRKKGQLRKSSLLPHSNKCAYKALKITPLPKTTPCSKDRILGHVHQYRSFLSSGFKHWQYLVRDEYFYVLLIRSNLGDLQARILPFSIIR